MVFCSMLKKGAFCRKVHYIVELLVKYSTLELLAEKQILTCGMGAID